MQQVVKKHYRYILLFIFIGLPAILYYTGDFPRRSWLKDFFSGLSILAFFMMLLQFHLSRGNNKNLKPYKMSKVIKWHKVLGYVFVSILLLHPFFIILPRYYDPGIALGDAFQLILANWSSQGILLGIIAWSVMLIIGITALLRKHIGLSYKNWRIIHGILSIFFVIAASAHVISLGRHINIPMRILILIITIIGIARLLKVYILESLNKKHSNEQ